MTEAEILRAIEGKEPALQRAYLDRVRSVTDAAVVVEIERYINEQDEDSIVSALSLGLLAVFLEQLRSTYLAGATLEIKFFPGRPVPEFDPVGPGPSTWLSEHARALQRDIDDATRLAVRHTIQMADLLGARRARQHSISSAGEARRPGSEPVESLDSQATTPRQWPTPAPSCSAGTLRRCAST